MLKELAVQVTTLCKLMEGREKMDTKELIERHPDGMHIREVEQFTMIDEKTEEETLIWAYTIVEEPKKFMFAGYVLKKIFDSWIASYDGDYDKLNKAIREENIAIQLSRSKTKSKQEITTVKVL